MLVTHPRHCRASARFVTCSVFLLAASSFVFLSVAGGCGSSKRTLSPSPPPSVHSSLPQNTDVACPLTSGEQHAAEWDKRRDSMRVLSCDELVTNMYDTRVALADRVNRMAVQFVDVWVNDNQQKSVGRELGMLTKEEEGKIGEVMRNSINLFSVSSAMLSSHIHMSGGLISQRKECIDPRLRLVLLEGLSGMYSLVKEEAEVQWSLYEGKDDRFVEQVVGWCQSIVRSLVKEIEGMQQYGKSLTTRQDGIEAEVADETSFADGRFRAAEALRRITFSKWFMDEGLLRFLIRNVFGLDEVIADFGAGGGHYSSWLNSTGLVTAYAFEGTPEIDRLTGGRVIRTNLLEDPLILPSWIDTTDWVLCLEVAEHIPKEKTDVLIEAIDKYAERGAIITWSNSSDNGIHHVNARGLEEWVALIEEKTTLRQDKGLSVSARAASDISWISQSATVFVRSASSPSLMSSSHEL
eukprot:GHVQ01004287.1.p1 GENE.GHVQ01004287.1~~GHVQ01004287.1.p1  ORF type:complete len:466 (+),score=72.10 GHVQ01004287.1:188-1585(+)